MQQNRIKVLIAFALGILISCDAIDFNYGKPDCGTTTEQTDSVSFTRENFPYNPYYEDYAGMIEVGLKLVATNFCAKDNIKANFYLHLLPDTASVYISALILSDVDTLEIPISWQSVNQTDVYTGTLESAFPSKNPGENFAVRIDLIFTDKGAYFANTEYIKRLLVKSGITATYRKKGE